MFDYQSELDISRMERERRLKALASVPARHGNGEIVKARLEPGLRRALACAWRWPSTEKRRPAPSHGRRRIRRAEVQPEREAMSA